MAIAWSKDSNVARRLRAPIDSVGPSFSWPVVRVDLAGWEHDRLERHDHIEQTGIAMCRHQQAGATHGVSESDQSTVGSNRPSGCQRIVAVSLPLDLPVIGAGGVAVAPVVDRVRREAVGERIRDREIAVPVESRRM